MNTEELIKIIQNGENSKIEFKKSTARLKSACETLCAFLNTDGGIVLIGVTDDKKCIGQEVADKTKQEIGVELSKITPHAMIEIEYLPVANTNHYIISLHAITDSTKKPYTYDGKAFYRQESDTMPMPQEYYHHLMLNNALQGHQWEDQTQDNVSLEDLDQSEIIKTIKEGVVNGRIPHEFSTDDPHVALQHLGLIKNNKITNAAIILYAKHPEKWFPQITLKLARFRGIDKTEFIDSKRVTGHAFKLLHETMAFASTYLPVASTFSKDSIERTDTPLFPILALREAVANAICHRNYVDSKGSLSLAIFDDRIEIWNYGLLPYGVEIDDLKQINQSIPRNARIANVFYYHKITEIWGRGINMIIKLCLEAGHPEPTYKQVAGGILLTLISKEKIGDTQAKTDFISQIHSTLDRNPTVKKDMEAKLSALFLTAKQQEILTILKNIGPLSTKALQKELKAPIPERTLRIELNNLKDLNLVNVQGETNARIWFVV